MLKMIRDPLVHLGVLKTFGNTFEKKNQHGAMEKSLYMPFQAKTFKHVLPF